MNAAERNRFDALLERVLDALPANLRALLEEAPLVVEDRPSAKLADELGLDADDELCGLHSGTPLTDRSVEAEVELPETIHLFREGIISQAGGWRRRRDEEGKWCGGPGAVQEEIRVTLLHEIGHHFGLEEDDLAGLGYE